MTLGVHDAMLRERPQDLINFYEKAWLLYPMIPQQKEASFLIQD
jgi:hypothetical protein